MIRKMYKFLPILFITISYAGIYGDDNRMELSESSLFQQKLGKATAGRLIVRKPVNRNSDINVVAWHLGFIDQLCKGVRFRNQLAPFSCSGFLVAEDILVTAGHCMRNPKQDCTEQAWVFDYHTDEDGNSPRQFSHKNIYYCKDVIDHKLTTTDPKIQHLYYGEDYAVIRLDRPVLDREPLKIRTSGKIPDYAPLFTIGNPGGVATKVADNGLTWNNNFTNWFSANLDTFGANSGSAVFNAETGVVEGILVRGATDYKYEPDYSYNGEEERLCGRVWIHSEDIPLDPSDHVHGEGIARITNLKKLIDLLDKDK